MKEFKGRIVASGTVTAKGTGISRGPETLASFQKGIYSSAIKKQPAEIRIIPTSMVEADGGQSLMCLPTTWDLPPADWYFTVPAP